MTKEELIKNQFPNDEFLQSAVLQIVDKCVADLEKENAELRAKESFVGEQIQKLHDQQLKIEVLEERNRQLKNQIEKMKCCPTCDNNKEEHTPEGHYRCKTCKKFCNWELAD